MRAADPPLRGTIPVPAHLVGQVSDSALVTLGVVIKLAQAGYNCYTANELARRRNVSVRQIRRHVSELIEWEALRTSADHGSHVTTWEPLQVLMGVRS